MATTGYRADLDLARSLADLADAITLDRFGAGDLAVTAKPDLTPVTDADHAVEDALRIRLAAERPDDAVVGEEMGAAGSADRTWIIDPIDGTKNFIRRVPIWAVLIGLEEAGQVTAGVVLNPASGEMLWAHRGDGAWDRDGRLRVSDCGRLAEATVLHSDLHLLRQGSHWDAFLRMVDGSRRSRGFGDYYGYGLVAAGKAELYLEVDLKPWDVAPMLVLLEEAGGRLTDFSGRATIYDGSVLATNGRLHEQILALLRR
jgi:histidinol-phosphatase